MRTSTQTAEILNDVYARALQRAKRSGIRVCGRGHLKENGWPFVAVSSSKDATHWHIVTIAPNRLFCDCYAGLRCMLCKHRALVHEELLRLWRAERDRIEREEEAALAAALRELNEQLSQPASSLLGTAGVFTAPVRGTAPVISQRQAGELLGASKSARDYRPDVRGFNDVAPVTIWKR